MTARVFISVRSSDGTDRPAPRAVTARPAGAVDARGRSRPQLQLRIRVRVGDVVAIGPGKIALLEAVRAQGSISAAARTLAMSYRRAWLLLDELNRSLAEAAVVTAQGGRQGGGARVTASGEALLELYRRIESESLAATRRDTARLLRMLAKGAPEAISGSSPPS